MVELATVALILLGLAFLFFGAAFSSYGVSALGLIVGAGTGYLIAPSIAGAVGISSMAATAGAIVGGAVIGVILGYALLSLAVGLLALIIGTYVGLAVVAGLLVDSGGYVEILVAIGFGILLGVLGTVLTKTMMVLLTSFLGAALASQAISVDGLTEAQAELTTDPLLFDVVAPLFLGLFVLGVLAQFGLFKFGYVAKILRVLPGVRPLKNRASRD